MKRLYGASPLHLLALGFTFTLLGYIVYVAGIQTFWNKDVWWQSIGVWFAGSVIAHDLVLYPLYAIADRTLSFGLGRTHRMRVSPLNYVRVPALGTALTFALFFPGIVQQGSETYRTATGLTQEPYLGRWLLLSAALFGISALVYAIRLASSRRPS